VTHPSTTRDDVSHFPVEGITAIATCTATLCLDKVPDGAKPSLKQMLRLYDGSYRQLESFSKRSKADIFADLHFSNTQLEAAWTSLVAFEELGVCARPTAVFAMQVWKIILAAATLESIDLTSDFLVEDLWTSTEESEFSRPLFDALIRRLAVGPVDAHASLSRAEVLTWVGITYMENLIANYGEDKIEVTNLVTSWKTLLPEKWRDDVDLDFLKEYTTQPSKTTVALKQNTNVEVGTGADGEKKVTGGARKWHEKFKKARK